jgi:hypothetical protein
MEEKDVREMICKRFLGGDTAFPLSLETRLLEEGIVSEIESRHPKIRIADQEITRENFGSIGAILNYISRKQTA